MYLVDTNKKAMTLRLFDRLDDDITIEHFH